MSQTRRGALADAVAQLGPQYQRDCNVMLAACLNVSQSGLHISLDDSISDTELEKFNAMVEQRANHRPVAQIIGKRNFWKHEFIVSDAVLDPRPDTETLIEVALSLPPFKTVLDLGTGSGCILLSLLAERPNAVGVGTDVSPSALEIARQNARKLSLDSRTTLKQGSWLDGIEQKFDLIVSNPPYITAQEMLNLDTDVAEFEPRIALTPEGDGLDAYRQIARTVGDAMESQANLLLEIGAEQKQAVSDIFEAENFTLVNCHLDINGKDRVLHFVAAT